MLPNEGPLSLLIDVVGKEIFVLLQIHLTFHCLNARLLHLSFRRCDDLEELRNKVFLLHYLGNVVLDFPLVRGREERLEVGLELSLRRLVV